MIQWIMAHPFLSAAALWAAAIFLLLWLLWRKGSTTSAADGEAVEDRVSLMASLMSLGLVKRIEMRPRFLPKAPHDPVRSEMLAAQILSDQAGAGETAGRVAHAPAPGDRHYRAPERPLRITIGQWSIIMRRGERTRVIDRSRAGVEIPAYPVPEEWNDLVTAMAFEIGRLREGWDVTKP